MGIASRDEVHGRLRSWADREDPQPSAELLGLIGPVPVAATGSRAITTAARFGLGLKVLIATSALAMTSAAAVGISQVVTNAPHGGEPVEVTSVQPVGSQSTSSRPELGPAPAPSAVHATSTATRKASHAGPSSRTDEQHSTSGSDGSRGSDPSDAPEPSPSEAGSGDGPSQAPTEAPSASPSEPDGEQTSTPQSGSDGS